MNPEKRRLEKDRSRANPWREWGPYLAERQWGTVREDYSADGDAWDYFTHDDARSRAYRWGEDGIGGISDHRQRLCLAVALWNGRDPFLKERLFGLTNDEGNHGEDVKESYYYLDATPTHSYLKMLYKYPQREFPYEELVRRNGRRDREAPEYELMDTGIFDDDRYFDVFIEYAKAGTDDILMRLTVWNRAPDEATLHILPQLWCRNTWSWRDGQPKPVLSLLKRNSIRANHPELGDYRLYFEGSPDFLFCDNETNERRLYSNDGGPAYPKDAFHDYVVSGRADAVNPDQTGTKAAACYSLKIPAGGEATIHARLSDKACSAPFDDFDEMFTRRTNEADAFYSGLQCQLEDEDARRVQRQALAGMIWSKQFYHFNVYRWLHGDPAQPDPPRERLHGRNWEWQHLNNADVFSMPDKWEYPWYAAWDSAFQCLPFALVDPDFAKDQLVLLTREWYMHPNGQLPAYEWEFGDVNPPVHAWAAWRVYQIDRKYHGGKGDVPFLERVFHKLMLNFTWWVNRKDAQGHNIFQGGFLGMDNIGLFDRSAALPTGGYINQADGTSWMAMYSLNLMTIALELAKHNPVYEDIATKFLEHFLHIAAAMTNIADEGLGLWDEDDEFYYDVLNLPGNRLVPLKIRSMVGLVPLFAVETLEPELLDRLPVFKRRLEWLLDNRPDLARLVSHWDEPGRGERRLLSLLRGHRMKCLLRRMLDPDEFLSDYGVRSLSRHHLDTPFEFELDGRVERVAYRSGESDSGLFGGNSNWRGPIWFPVNFLIVESLQKFHHYYGDEFKVECPTGSGRFVTINDIADEISRRLTRLFLRDDEGGRPAFGACEKHQADPHFRDHVLFYEYFDGDTGRGCGASHQTGWTGLVAKLLQPRAEPCH